MAELYTPQTNTDSVNQNKTTQDSSMPPLYGLPIENTPYIEPINQKTNTIREKNNFRSSTTDASSISIPMGDTPSLPEEGAIWNDVNKKAFCIAADHANYYNRMIQKLNYTHLNQSTSLTVYGNDELGSTQRLLTGLVQTYVGVAAIPANYLVVGKTIRVKCSGYYSTSSSGSTLALSLYLIKGNFFPSFTNLYLIGSSSSAIATGLATQMWTYDFIGTIRSVGTSGTIIGQGMFQWFESGTLKATPVINTSTVTIDTTADLDIALWAAWTSNNSNTITCTNALIEIIN